MMELPIPCGECVAKTLAKVPSDGSGSLTAHCPHELVGFVLHFQGGEFRRWGAAHMTPEQVAERNRIATRAIHKQQGLRPVK